MRVSSLARGGVLTNVAPAVSLIVSTKGAQHRTAQLLDSLERQTCKDFELIIVEQNSTSLFPPLIEKGWSFPIVHAHAPGERGLSRGRNAGLARARADFVLFPDDDCWYPHRFLEEALHKLRSRDLDALTGRATGEDGRTVSGRFERRAQWISEATVWTTQIEWIAFWRRDLLEHLGGYDEMIGVGAESPWRSAEGQDLMLRALSLGARCWYDPTLTAHNHGDNPARADRALISKARAYGRGFGHVMRKHRLGFRPSSYFISRSIGGAAWALVRGQLPLARFHAATAFGRLEGVLGRCFENFEYDRRLTEPV